MRHRIDGVLRPVGAEPDRGNESPLEIVSSIKAGLGREQPAVLPLERR